ncbi:hypothetical protein SAMN05428945_4573 [Streptomyces sp. 2224.1]|nr:hypothetical protein SAMN05428945_4573 [Streptomyces sp. 2224.1]
MTGTTGGRHELAELLQHARLEIVGGPLTEEVLPPRAAWRPVVSFEAEPTVTVPLDRPDLVAECERRPLTGPNPTDRGKPGSRIRLVTDRNGLPLSLGISGTALHDSQALEPLIRGIPPIRSRRGPAADGRQSSTPTRATTTTTCADGCTAEASPTASPARGIEPSQRLGRHRRWVVERTVSWPAGCRRLHRRYERKAARFPAFVGIATSLIGYRRLMN